MTELFQNGWHSTGLEGVLVLFESGKPIRVSDSRDFSCLPGCAYSPKVLNQELAKLGVRLVGGGNHWDTGEDEGETVHPLEPLTGPVVSPIEIWRERVATARAEDEELWAELNQTVEAMIAAIAAGDSAQAHALAEQACNTEYEITLSCDMTGELCQELGIELDPDDAPPKLTLVRAGNEL